MTDGLGPLSGMPSTRFATRSSIEFWGPAVEVVAVGRAVRDRCDESGRSVVSGTSGLRRGRWTKSSWRAGD